MLLQYDGAHRHCGLSLLANEARFFGFRVFFGACSLQNEVGDPPFFFAFLAKVDHDLSAWQV